MDIPQIELPEIPKLDSIANISIPEIPILSEMGELSSLTSAINPKEMLSKFMTTEYKREDSKCETKEEEESQDFSKLLEEILSFLSSLNLELEIPSLDLDVFNFNIPEIRLGIFDWLNYLLDLLCRIRSLLGLTENLINDTIRDIDDRLNDLNSTFERLTSRREWLDCLEKPELTECEEMNDLLERLVEQVCEEQPTEINETIMRILVLIRTMQDKNCNISEETLERLEYCTEGIYPPICFVNCDEICKELQKKYLEAIDAYNLEIELRGEFGISELDYRNFIKTIYDLYNELLINKCYIPPVTIPEPEPTCEELIEEIEDIILNLPILIYDEYGTILNYDSEFYCKRIRELLQQLNKYKCDISDELMSKIREYLNNIGCPLPHSPIEIEPEIECEDIINEIEELIEELPTLLFDEHGNITNYNLEAACERISELLRKLIELGCIVDEELLSEIIEYLDTIDCPSPFPEPDNNFIRCAEKGFKIHEYLITGRLNYPDPIVTPKKIENLENIYNKLLMPIVKYYSDLGLGNKNCMLSILGMGSMPHTVAFEEGINISNSIEGKGIGFTINGINSFRVFKDIKDRLISIDYGLLVYRNVFLFITLPFEVNRQLIEKVCLNTSNQKILLNWNNKEI
jgi:hypothetical protein